MAPHSSTLAWKIPWKGEPGRLQAMGSLRVRHDLVTSLSLFTFMCWRRKWQPTPVFLPGESQGWGSLVGCCLWGCRVRHDWSDLAAAAAVSFKWVSAINLPQCITSLFGEKYKTTIFFSLLSHYIIAILAKFTVWYLGYCKFADPILKHSKTLLKCALLIQNIYK